MAECWWNRERSCAAALVNSGKKVCVPGSCFEHCSSALVQICSVRSEKNCGNNRIILCDQKRTCAEFRQMTALFVYMRKWRIERFRSVTFHYVFFENADFSNCRNRIRNSENPQNRFCDIAFRERFSLSAFARRNHLWFQGCEHRICVHTWNKIRSFWGNTQNPDFEKSAVESNRYHSAKKTVFVILWSAKLKRDFWKATIFGNQNRKRKILYFGILDLFFWNILSPVLPVCICKNPRCFRGLRAQILGTVSAPKSTGKANRRKLRKWKKRRNKTGRGEKQITRFLFCR